MATSSQERNEEASLEDMEVKMEDKNGGEEDKSGLMEEDDDESEKKKRKMSSKLKEGSNSTPKVERPTRERKAVERYSMASPISRSSSGKSLEIAKGSGTPLKDIPNVAYKLSKKKPDDNLQHLHTILFGKKAKVHNLKKDIGQFSGFVWTDNEEKQRAKTKEKLDKCVKEKLIDFCDVLNIPINRSSVKKEDLSVKLLEFLESPQVTTDVLLADKEQKAKKPKKKVTPVKSPSSKASNSEKSSKKSESGKKRKRTPISDGNIEDDDNDDNQSHSSQGEDIEIDSEEEEVEEKTKNSKNSAKNNNSVSKNGKKSSKSKRISEKPGKSPAKSAKKTSGTPKKSTPVVNSKEKASSSKKRKVNEENHKEKPEKSSSKKQTSKSTGKSVVKDQGKGKTKKETKREPTNEELRAQAVNTLKEVDFNTATLSDILRLLGSHFGLDLMHRKAEIKTIITEVIENMSDDDDDDEDEDKEDSDNE